MIERREEEEEKVFFFADDVGLVPTRNVYQLL